VATELLALYAQREAMEREPCRPDPEWLVADLQQGFGFDPTPGQHRAFDDVQARARSVHACLRAWMPT
jgi:transcription-repair coupling factor (superfamily II helicase)